MLRIRKRHTTIDPAETRFERMMDLVKDLSEADYKRMIKAMNAGYTAYNTVRNIESKSIESLESELEEV